MEQEKKGPFNLSMPIGYEVTMVKLPQSDEWSLTYIEENEPTITDEQLKQAAEKLNRLTSDSGLEHTVKDGKIVVKMRGKREALAAAMMMEFMAATDLGKMTLAELVVLAGLGAIKIGKLNEAIGGQSQKDDQ
jgi:hypothetical protein